MRQMANHLALIVWFISYKKLYTIDFMSKLGDVLLHACMSVEDDQLIIPCSEGRLIMRV